MPLFLNSIISLSPFYLHPQDNSRRRQPHGISSALVHIPERTKHSRRSTAENTTTTQQQPDTQKPDLAAPGDSSTIYPGSKEEKENQEERRHQLH